jgi:hypothetical protein
VRVDHVFRFQATNAASETFKAQDLGDLLCVATNTNVAYQLANAVKIRKIEMWGPPASSLTPVTVSLDWTGEEAGSFGNQRKIMDTSVGATRSAHICVKPPKTSQLSQWQPPTGGASPRVLCDISYPANAIIDLHFSVMLRGDTNGTNAAQVGAAVTGATVGQVYCRALTSNTSSNLKPVGFLWV